MKRCAYSISIVAALTTLSALALASSHASRFPADRVSAVRAGHKAALAAWQWEVDIPEINMLETGVVGEPAGASSLPVAVSMDFGQEDLYLLAKIAMAEAEEEDTEGKALVIQVVLNRIADNGFPDTIEGVIYQPWQFTPVSDGRLDSVEPNEDCWKALDLVMAERWDESCGATYFESESNSTWHRENLEFLFAHGKLYFYIDREGDDA